MSADDRRSEPHRLTPHGAFVLQFEVGTALAGGAVGGRVEHVQSGRATHFTSLDELLRFLDAVLAQVRRTRGYAQAARPFTREQCRVMIDDDNLGRSLHCIDQRGRRTR